MALQHNMWTEHFTHNAQRYCKGVFFFCADAGTAKRRAQ
jgi:hypothetical protein